MPEALKSNNPGPIRGRLMARSDNPGGVEFQFVMNHVIKLQPGLEEYFI